MTTLDAFDYSWSRPNPQQLAAAGIKAVARYLFGPGKGIDDAERRALHAAGVGIVLNYEGNSGNHLKGAIQGATDGAAARNYARQLGAPVGTPIYYSCDQQVFPSSMPAVMAYLHAADAGDHPARAYGQFSVLEKFGRPGWQTIAWSSGLISKHAVLYQYEIQQDFHGSQVDYDQILNIDELGAWWPEGSEHNMPTADEIAQAVWDQQLSDGSTKQPAAAWLRQARNLSDSAAKRAAALILAKLPDEAGGLTKAQVKAAVESGLQEAFAKAGTP